MEALLVELTIDILSRLPVKTIIHCKLICKKWRNLVSDSSFVNLHLLRSSPTTGLSVHQNAKYLRDSGILNWVEIEDKADDHHHLRYETILDLNTLRVLQNSHTSQMGSVNGLICLWQSSRGHDNTYICNPITQEIVILPTSQYRKHRSAIIAYGSGVSSLTGEYKVVRTLNRFIRSKGNKSKMVSEAEVYALGTGQWRTLGRVPCWIYGSEVGVVLNDRCHWILSDYEDAPERIGTFDLNTETFQLFPSPPESVEGKRWYGQSLSILKDCLCKLDTCLFELTIWVMKEYGFKNSWHKEVVITRQTTVDLKWPSYTPVVHLIAGLKDGSVLMVFENKLCVFDPRSQTIEDTKMFDSYSSGWAYRPSFLKLQNFKSERVHMF